MNNTIASLKVGQKAIICDIAIEHIPLKLLEMGCLPGKEVMLIQKAPFNDPLYIKVNGSHLAIRVETAALIEVKPIVVETLKL
jgi:ferrous iron transport protein A